MKEEYKKLSNEERQAILEKKGTLLSEDEWAEIDRRWFNSPMGQMIAAFGSRMPRINKRADGKGLCKLRKPAATSGSLWHGEDSRLACLIDEQIEKAEDERRDNITC